MTSYGQTRPYLVARLAEEAGRARTGVRSGMAESGFTETLLQEHLDTVYRYALRLTGSPDAAADLVQETMLRAWRSRHSLREAGAAKVWLLRIADNTHCDAHRRHMRLSPLEEPPDNGRPPAHKTIVGNENLNRALAALDALPDRQRRVMHLAVCESMPHAEVAEVLGITPQAVKSNLAAARKKLRERLSDIDTELVGNDER